RCSRAAHGCPRRPTPSRIPARACGRRARRRARVPSFAVPWQQRGPAQEIGREQSCSSSARRADNPLCGGLMQKFTRALTREIEIGGERLALTLSEEGLSVRPVGSRRPPHTMSWAAWLCALAEHRGEPPTNEQIEKAIKTLRSGAGRSGA